MTKPSLPIICMTAKPSRYTGYEIGQQYLNRFNGLVGTVTRIQYNSATLKTAKGNYAAFSNRREWELMNFDVE